MAFAVLAAASCAPEDQPTGDAVQDSVSALVSIERAQYLHGDEARAEAAAHFARIPGHVNRTATLQALGLIPELPNLGECFIGPEEFPTGSQGSVLVELLEAGDVSIEADGRNTLLALRAIPSVSNVTGVLYTTLDRSAVPFPPGATYRATSTGGELDAFTIEAEAPDVLEAVRFDGLAWRHLPYAPIAGPFEVSWDGGNPADVVVIEFTVGDRVHAQCAFPDRGTGQIPSAAVPTDATGYVSMHRLRVVDVAAAPMDGAELHFDFSVHAPVTYAAP